VNAAPVLGPVGNQVINEGNLLTFQVTASDADLPANTLTLSAANLPAGATFDPATGVFSWTPTEAQGPGTYQVNFTVSDGSLTDSRQITITVNELNAPPVLGSIANQVVNEGSLLTFQVTASDADLPANTLTLSAANLPTGATFDPATGVFSWTPTEAQGPGTYQVNFTVSDGSLTDSRQITITVNEVNAPPVLAPTGNRSVLENSSLTFTAAATDPDIPAQQLRYSLDAAAQALGMQINPATGEFTWTPGPAHTGLSFPVTITVSDGSLTDSETIVITVTRPNQPPVLDSIGPKTVNEHAPLTFTATATDPDLPGQTLTFSLDAASLARGMTINPLTGRFSWTPGEDHGGQEFWVTITVTDNGLIPPNLFDSETFKVTVNEVNAAPVLGPVGNQVINEGSLLTFQVTASDPDLPPNTLVLSAANLPAGATFDPATGVFQWTPTEAQGPAAYTVTFTVSDGSLTDSKTITITVNEVNSAPVLSPIGAKSVQEGATLAFTASATDADVPAQTLTYSLDAASLALGMSINPLTGAFTWTPTLAQTGRQYWATIRVTDNGTNPPNLTAEETIRIDVQYNPNPVVQAPAGPGSNSLLVSREGDDLVVTDLLAPAQGAGAAAGQVLRRQPLSSVQSLTIQGVDNKADRLTVDLASGGAFTLPGGLHFDGGRGTATDVLAIVGTPGDDRFVIQSGHVVANDGRVGFAGVERVEILGGQGNDAYVVGALAVPVALTDGFGVDTLDFSQSALVGVKIDLNLSSGKPQSVFGSRAKTLALNGLFANVVGTPGADTIKGNRLANRIWGGAGNDTIYGGSGDDWLYGGDGNDKVYGDAGNDVLLGGSGNDQLRGVSGRDLLIAGLGVDSLYGSSGDTILIGGETTYDNNDLALAEIMKEWTAARTFQERVNRLDQGVVTALGTIALKRRTATEPNGTVLDDAVRDNLFGAAGNDWFLNFGLDVVKNRSKNDR